MDQRPAITGQELRIDFLVCDGLRRFLDGVALWINHQNRRAKRHAIGVRIEIVHLLLQSLRPGNVIGIHSGDQVRLSQR